MRPLIHPSIGDVTVEVILYALADPVRVAILAGVMGQERSQNCATFSKVIDKPIAKSTLSLHFKALREAGLIRGERRGVEMLNTSRCAEVEGRFPGLVSTIVNAYEKQIKERSRGVRTKGKKGARLTS